jgi:hypothetical protein
VLTVVFWGAALFYGLVLAITFFVAFLYWMSLYFAR